MAYSKDLREKVVGAYETGNDSYDSLAARFDVGRATVNRWLRLKRETGDVQKRPHGGGQPMKVIGKAVEALRRAVAAKNDSTRPELAKVLQKTTGMSVSDATIGRALRRLGFTRKKRRFITRRETPTAL
jgi:transposase